MVKVTWFKNSHEQRLNWLKFGLMQLHHLKQIIFIEKNNAELIKENLHPDIVNHIHRHTVLVKVQIEKSIKFVLVDAEDSFFQLCPLIEYVDDYYCSAYNTDFFHHKKFNTKFEWQSEADIESYKIKANELIEKFGAHFQKVKKLFPIGPNLDFESRTRNFFWQKYSNLKNKIYQWFIGSNNWHESYNLFQMRYNQLLSYRNMSVEFEIVLLDTLWGWPEHRIKLHKQLIELSSTYNILSELRFNSNEQTKHIDNSKFPMVSKPIIKDYEYKLASSRLAVFASGFHFGWRNIMFFALMIGIPVYADEIILEPYFNLNEFEIYWNKYEFENLENKILSLDPKRLQEIKVKNQIYFDKVMNPEACAHYFINSILFT